MITIVTWLWEQDGYKKKYDAQHVNTLCSMVARHLSLPHEFVCVTDMREGLHPAIRVVPLPQVRVSWHRHRPNCFRRLWAFSPEARAVLGPRIASFDLDCVVLKDLTPLLSRTEPFVIWKDPLQPSRFNGSLWLHTTGSMTRIWSTFKGQDSVRKMDKRFGSDQSWLTKYACGAPTFGSADGVLSYKKHIGPGVTPPPHARIVFFHGYPSPWDVRASWVAENYR